MKKIFLIAILILLFNSCFKDVPTSIEQQNDPNIYVPQVNNFKFADSISNLIYHGINGNTIANSNNHKVYTILSSEYHLGFPDITKFENNWYVSLRLSEGHMPEKMGNVLIYKSNDLKKWELEQVYTQNGYDIRDPKLLVANNKMYIHFNSTTISPYGESRNDYISEYNQYSKKWNNATKINKNSDKKSWFWRITYHNGKFYTISYSAGKIQLFESSNGIDFKPIYNYDSNSILTESTLRFHDYKAYILIRVNRGGETLLGVSDENSLTSWTFKTLAINEIGGPNFLFYNNYIFLSGRNIDRTSLFSYNLNTSLFTDTGLSFPSGGDTGYPGMLIENDILYLVYYSAANPGSRKISNSINLAIIDMKSLVE